MRVIKTSTLSESALDWAVASCQYKRDQEEFPNPTTSFEYFQEEYSTDWSQAGPIIEREVIRWNKHERDGIYAWIGGTHHDALYTPMSDGLGGEMPHPRGFAWGDSLLIAAMRCYVMSKLGDEVEIPEETL